MVENRERRSIFDSADKKTERQRRKWWRIGKGAVFLTVKIKKTEI
jgi:hypothetical protein